jgi:hypothetical protein
MDFREAQTLTKAFGDSANGLPCSYSVFPYLWPANSIMVRQCHINTSAHDCIRNLTDHTDSTHETKESASHDPYLPVATNDTKPPPPYRTRSNFLSEMSQAVLPNRASRQNLVVEQNTWTNLHYHDQFDLYWYKGYLILILFLELEIGIWLIAMGSHWRYPGPFPVKNWWLPLLVVGTTALYPFIFVCLEIFAPWLKSTILFSRIQVSARRQRIIYIVFVGFMVLGIVFLIHLFANLLIGYQGFISVRISGA